MHSNFYILSNTFIVTFRVWNLVPGSSKARRKKRKWRFLERRKKIPSLTPLHPNHLIVHNAYVSMNSSMCIVLLYDKIVSVRFSFGWLFGYTNFTCPRRCNRVKWRYHLIAPWSSSPDLSSSLSFTLSLSFSFTQSLSLPLSHSHTHTRTQTSLALSLSIAHTNRLWGMWR